MMDDKKGFTTTILHADRLLMPEFGALHQPVHNSVTWGYNQVEDLVNVFQNKTKGYAYSRQGNPTVSALENKITQMEDGLASVAFATGMAAITATMIALLKAGDHVVASTYLFGNTRSIMQTLKDIGIQISFVDATDCANIVQACQPNTKMVLVETIANPGTQIADLVKAGTFCSQKGLIYVVDNTMTSPYLFRPVDVKASLVINSLTKYIGGHGSALGGCVTDTGLYDWAAFPNIAPVLRNQTEPKRQGITQIRKRGLRDGGGTLSPVEAHSLSIGSETLALRMERACANAAVLAKLLEAHPLVSKVNYPGLESHPQHLLGKQIFRHSGALMSFVLDDAVDCFDFLNRLKLVIKSSNLGDTRTLAIPVAHTIFFELGSESRAQMGIPDSMIRLSVGIEDIDDLTNDFTQALT
jgi:O-acetylhomoserine (thiol)-lyase